MLALSLIKKVLTKKDNNTTTKKCHCSWTAEKITTLTVNVNLLISFFKSEKGSNEPNRSSKGDVQIKCAG